MSSSEDNCYEAGSNSVAFVTTPDENSAKKLARGLVEHKLAACVNIIPQIQSIYMWEGKVTEDSEYLMMIKTRTSRIADLTKWVRENHSYSVAEVIAVPIQQGNEPYLKWISQTINQNDNLPSIICEKCVQRLKVCYDFIKLARRSDANLRAFINKVGQDFQQITKKKSLQETQQLYDVHTDLESQEQKDQTIQKLTRYDGEKEESRNALKSKSTSIKVYNNNKKQNSNQSVRPEVFEVTLTGPLVKKETKISALDLPSDKANNLMGTVSTKAKFSVINKNDNSNIIINNNEENAITHIQYNEEEEEEEVEDILEMESDIVYLQDYESLLEDDEFIDENSQEEQELKFTHEIVSYENVEDELQDDPICNDNTNTDTVSDIIMLETITDKQDEELIKTETNVNTETARVVKARRRRNNKPSTGTEARFICTTCNRDFTSRQNLNRHMRAHEGKKRFVCKECGKSFSQNGSLKQHSYTHTGERPYKCATCDRGFTQWKSLSFHMRRHTGEKPFPCEYCDLAFRQKDGLKSHLMKYHLTTSQSGTTKMHACSLCKKELPTKELLTEHMKRHLNKHKDVAGDILTDDSQLGSEMLVEYINEDEEHLIEEEEAPDLGHILASTTHVIDVGGTSAADPVRAKKYQCRTCFKCFAIMKNLIRHVSIHNLNLYQCEKCNLAFESNYAMKLHRMQKHEEIAVDLNECEECQLSFNKDNELDEHLRSAHGLMCSQCPKLTFKTRYALLEHQVDHEDVLAKYK